MNSGSTPADILIVDDNPAKLTALRATLSGLDLGIVTATSGMEALRYLLVQDFAAVLLDVNMPTMDGFETAAMIRSRPRSEHLPILFITAEALTQDRQLQGYALGAVDYVCSPVAPLILRAKVTTFADLYRLRDKTNRYADKMLRKNAEIARQNDALRENDRQLRELQHIARLGSFSWHLARGQWQCSAELEAWLGIDAGYEHSAAGWAALVHPDDRAMMADALSTQALVTHQGLDKECRLISPAQGTEHWVHLIGRLESDAEGRPLGLLGTLQDITEHKRLLEELKQVRRREEATREHETMTRIAGASASGSEPPVYPLPLKQADPDLYDRLVQGFRNTLDQALEQRFLRVNYPIGQELRTLAEQMGGAKAGPRDAIDLHLAVLNLVSQNVPAAKAQAYSEEARLLVLELMGNLVAFYRKAILNGPATGLAAKEVAG